MPYIHIECNIYTGNTDILFLPYFILKYSECFNTNFITISLEHLKLNNRFMLVNYLCIDSYIPLYELRKYNCVKSRAHTLTSKQKYDMKLSHILHLIEEFFFNYLIERLISMFVKLFSNEKCG